MLDFGCGPGHDLVGFATVSRPARLIGIDVSPSSIAEARERLSLHQAVCEFIQLDRLRPSCRSRELVSITFTRLEYCTTFRMLALCFVSFDGC